MVVFIITEGHDQTFYGVFSSFEKAKEYTNTLQYPNSYHILACVVDEVEEEE